MRDRVTKQEVETTLTNLQQLLNEAEKYVRERQSELRTAENKRDALKREIEVWETTIAAFKKAGIV